MNVETRMDEYILRVYYAQIHNTLNLNVTNNDSGIDAVISSSSSAMTS